MGLTPLITVCWYASGVSQVGHTSSGAGTAGADVKVGTRRDTTTALELVEQLPPVVLP